MRKIGKMVSGGGCTVDVGGGMRGKEGRGADFFGREESRYRGDRHRQGQARESFAVFFHIRRAGRDSLGNQSECIIQDVSAIDIYEGNIYILDDEVPALYVFRRDGTFLRRIGHQGRGARGIP